MCNAVFYSTIAFLYIATPHPHLFFNSLSVQHGLFAIAIRK